MKSLFLNQLVQRSLAYQIYSQYSHIIDGKKIANKLLSHNKSIISDYSKQYQNPALAIVMVGEDPASKLYVKNKQLACKKIGIDCAIIQIDGEKLNTQKIIQTIQSLNENKHINSIIVQLPLPNQFNDQKQMIIDTISPSKDADCLVKSNYINFIKNGEKANVIPCTTQGILYLIDSIQYSLESKHAVVVGKSHLVGLPTALALSQRQATVTICNSKTQSIQDHVKNADILVSCTGVPNLIQPDWIKKDSILIDVGIGFIEIIDENNQKKKILTGDINKDGALKYSSYYTPVPGGVGPMTVACLLQNVVKQWLQQNQVNEQLQQNFTQILQQHQF